MSSPERTRGVLSEPAMRAAATRPGGSREPRGGWESTRHCRHASAPTVPTGRRRPGPVDGCRAERDLIDLDTEAWPLRDTEPSPLDLEGHTTTCMESSATPATDHAAIVAVSGRGARERRTLSPGEEPRNEAARESCPTGLSPGAVSQMRLLADDVSFAGETPRSVQPRGLMRIHPGGAGAVVRQAS